MAVTSVLIDIEVGGCSSCIHCIMGRVGNLIVDDCRTTVHTSLIKGVSQTHCRPRPELDIDLIPDYLSHGDSEDGARPIC